jgi:hypothetical protein
MTTTLYKGLKMNRLHLAAIVCCAFVLFGCDINGSGSSDTPESDAPKRNDDRSKTIVRPPPSYQLPPDPGIAGKATLSGIDSNNNGVRDDVEIAIYKFAPSLDQETQRQALMQAAKGFQASVLAGDQNNTELALAALEEMLRGLQCLGESYPDDSIRTATTLLEITIANTDERLFAYWRYNELLSGRIYESVDYPNPCNTN